MKIDPTMVHKLAGIVWHLLKHRQAFNPEAGEVQIAEGTQFGAAPPARECDQVWKSKVKMGIVRSGVAIVEVSARISAVQEVEGTNP